MSYSSWFTHESIPVSTIATIRLDQNTITTAVKGSKDRHNMIAVATRYWTKRTGPTNSILRYPRNGDYSGMVHGVLAVL